MFNHILIRIASFAGIQFDFFFFFQAEDGIRDEPRSRGLGDVIRDRTTGVSTW